MFTDSNKLARVQDLAGDTRSYPLGDFNDGTNSDDDYTYDANGNLTQDQNKQIQSISYHILNLPETITVTGKGSILYLYDAAGTKLAKQVTQAGSQKTTSYLGAMIFENDILQHISMEEGRFRPNGTVFTADYLLKDHLGNVRAMVNEDGSLLEETGYYPFGLTQKGISTQAAGNLANKDKTFQGQKFDDDLGLNYYGFKWRNHDPQIGRFTEIDPLASDYEYNSTYAFSENRVIDGKEVEGLEWVSYLNDFAADVWEKGIKPGLDFINETINPLVPIAEAATGKSYSSNFTENTSRGKALVETAISVVPVGKVAGAIEKGVTKAVEKAVVNLSAKEAEKVGLKEGEKVATSSRAARREVMRDAGIPTSQQPKSQSKNASGREYTYETTGAGGKKTNKSVQQQSKDRNHSKDHWEAGQTKKDDHGNIRYNDYGRPKLENQDKTKVYY